MKNERAKRAKTLFFIVKYANLRGFCCRRRRGCLSSLVTSKDQNLGFVKEWNLQLHGKGISRAFSLQTAHKSNTVNGGKGLRTIER